MKKKRVLFVIAMLILAIAVVSQSVMAETIGNMIGLGTQGGFTSYAKDVNDRGQVVGRFVDLQYVDHAFLWADGLWIDLGLYNGKAEAINDRGQVVGRYGSPVALQAFLWDDGVALDLGTLGGPSSEAYAINERGQVVGNSSLSGQPSHAFLWDAGVMTDLGTLPGHDSSYAYGINERGQVVGESCAANYDPCHAVRWDDGVIVDLHQNGWGNMSAAEAINDREQVVGSYKNGDGERQAVRWDDGVATDLGALTSLGHERSLAYAINNLGQVAGASCPSGYSGPCHAFLWTDGTMFDLGAVEGDDYSDARGINERGQVAGYSYNTTLGSAQAFLWQKK